MINCSLTPNFAKKTIKKINFVQPLKVTIIYKNERFLINFLPFMLYNILKQLKKTSLFILIFSAIVFACRKEKPNDVKTGYIDITININLAQYNELTQPGGWIYLAGNYPSKGIIVYRRNLDEFMAYERQCTYDPNGTCKLLHIESNNIMAVDTVCGSKFILTDGSVVNPPASKPLMPYKTTFNDPYLRITN